MGPGFVRRDVRSRGRSAPVTSSRFNGARLRSPGCASTLTDSTGKVTVLQWGPASFAGMCSRHSAHPSGPSLSLQWGPASFAGMCPRPTRPRCRGHVVASMGPGFVRRDVRGGEPGHRLPAVASMGPGFVRRDVPGSRVPPVDADTALQWGPASFAGMCLPRPARLRQIIDASMGPGFVRRDVLQTLRPPVRAELVASMGPGFVRRDVPERRVGRAALVLLQWGPASFAGMCHRGVGGVTRGSRCFNGARLRSPGCADLRGVLPLQRHGCFNGARLRSPGCAPGCARRGRGDGLASMGPGFVRRDVPLLQAAPIEGNMRGASMGPGFVRRDVRRSPLG